MLKVDASGVGLLVAPKLNCSLDPVAVPNPLKVTVPARNQEPPLAAALITSGAGKLLTTPLPLCDAARLVGKLPLIRLKFGDSVRLSKLMLEAVLCPEAPNQKLDAGMFQFVSAAIGAPVLARLASVHAPAEFLTLV
jgi:hypothetical protein